MHTKRKRSRQPHVLLLKCENTLEFMPLKGHKDSHNYS